MWTKRFLRKSRKRIRNVKQMKRMAQLNPPLGRLLKMGLIGGGGAAFIGKVHAVAGKLDHRAEIAAAALSRDLETSRASAAAFGLTPEQAYGGAESLIASMADQLDFVAIATPNYTHAPIALAALNAGLHVICDKPMTTTAKDAQDLIQAVESSNRVFALTHNYTGYPLVRQAKAMVNSGDIGEIIAVRATYTQGWLHAMNPDETPARGAWKSDPELAGPSGALGDIGTHAYNLITHVTNLVPQKLSASIRSYAPVRALDDYGQVNIDFGNDVLGMVNFRMAFHIMEKAYFIFILVNLLKASKMVMENTISQKVISILVRSKMDKRLARAFFSFSLINHLMMVFLRMINVMGGGR